MPALEAELAEFCATADCGGAEVVVWLDGPAAEGEELALGGAGGRGAETPAISEPRPSFWSVGASSLPLESMPWADWNFSTAATVVESHLPLGSPW
jgi:hypothetical protein